MSEPQGNPSSLLQGAPGKMHRAWSAAQVPAGSTGVPASAHARPAALQRGAWPAQGDAGVGPGLGSRDSGMQGAGAARESCRDAEWGVTEWGEP